MSRCMSVLKRLLITNETDVFPFVIPLGEHVPFPIGE